jgi:hypothetical protein
MQTNDRQHTAHISSTISHLMGIDPNPDGPAMTIGEMIKAYATETGSHQTQCGYSSHPLGCKCDTEDVSDTAFATMIADGNF